MKACPKCNRTYSDETLSYCVVDGAVLSAPYDPNKTLVLPEPRTTDPPVDRPPPVSTITAVQPPAYSERPPLQQKSSRNFKPVLLVGLGLTTVSLLVVVIVLAFTLWGQQQQAEVYQPNSNATPSPKPTTQVSHEASPRSSPKESPTESPSASPTPSVAQPQWEKRDNTSINEGTRITYYPSTTPEQCQSDCKQNLNCRAATYIRAGAYNAGDPPMCYLMSAVKTLNPSTCCISFLRQE